jgi:hypothetical protein
MNICVVPLSIGELYDKYTILQIKREKITDTNKLAYVTSELLYLQPLIDKFNLEFEIVEKIKNVNKRLWEIEDSIRTKEAKQEFDDEFINLARLVYKTNDERYSIKTMINNIFKSEIQEMKHYQKYD